MNPKDEIAVRAEIVTEGDGPRKSPEQLMKEFIERQVADILVKNEAFIFEPFHRSGKVANEIRRLQTIPEWQKWGRYFEVWGCLTCGDKQSLHGGCGMCGPCYRRTRERLRGILKNYKGKYEEGQYERMIRDSEEVARLALLGEVKALAPPPANQSDEVYRTLQQVAAAAGIDPKTLSLWLRDGLIQPPARRISATKWLWTADDILQLKLLKSKNASQHNSKAAKARWGSLAKPPIVQADLQAPANANIVAEPAGVDGALAPYLLDESEQLTDSPRPRSRTQTQVAEEVGVSGKTISYWIKTGKLERPKKRMGPNTNSWLWSEEDVERVRKLVAASPQLQKRSK